MILSEVLSTNAFIARSVNLERDIGDKNTLSHYVLTAKGLEIISRFVAGLNGEKVSAWSLTGPYGMGKSSFANFLMSLCGPKYNSETKFARRILAEKERLLLNDFEKALARRRVITKGFFRVPVTSAFQPINLTLANGLIQSIKRSSIIKKEDAKALAIKIHHLIKKEQIDAQKLLELYKETAQRARSLIAIVIDEFGKSLEYMARHPSDGDIYIIQALAETEGIYLWVCLHQAFEEYSLGFSKRQLQEWGKIQGRFEDITFVEPRMQMVSFIAHTLKRKKHPPTESLIDRWADKFYKQAKRLNLIEFKHISAELIAQFYPLHPLAAMILPELCIRFAQNDRTLFAFLCGGESNALPAYLSSKHISPERNQLWSLGPEYLYDYFVTSMYNFAQYRPESHRWIEVTNMVENARRLPDLQYKICKIVGLLNLISSPLGFQASNKLISYALYRPFEDDVISEKTVQEALRSLCKKGILNYREYSDEYRLWEGTDFDITSAIQKQKEKFAFQSLVRILEKILPLSPLTASRHSYQTGTLRHFERKWCALSELCDSTPDCSSDEVDGLILYCFGQEPPPKALPTITKDGLPLVVAYANCEEQLREMILDVAAAEAILEESPELSRDGVARKEARFRLHVAKDRLSRFVNELFAPGNPEVTWYYKDKAEILSTHRSLSYLLSDLCDSTYSSCPVIRNELINRNKLSSAAARARRELMEAMLTEETCENLAMQGTGPEVAIYRTMFKAEGLHIEGENGNWQFVKPKINSTFFEAWAALLELTKKATSQAVPVQAFIDTLKRPPFGMKDGPIPVLLCLFFIIYSDEIAIYQEGAFVPFLGPEEMELMAKRPEYFKVRRFAPVGTLGVVFQLYRNLLNSQIQSHEKTLRNITLVNVVGPLIQFVNNLPFYVQHTKSLSKQAQNLRHALLNAREPIDLLFKDIPQALGIPPFDQANGVSEEAAHEFQTRFRSALIELSQAYEHLLRRIEEVFLDVLSENDFDALCKKLEGISITLLSRCTDKDLRPFVSCLSRSYATKEKWIIAISTIVSGRPVESWRDVDEDAFPAKLNDFVRRFKALEAIAAAEKGSLGTKHGQEARFISLTRPDGQSYSELIWLNRRQKKGLRKSLSNLKKEYSLEELKCLFALLGDHIMNSRKHREKEKP